MRYVFLKLGISPRMSVDDLFKKQHFFSSNWLSEPLQDLWCSALISIRAFLFIHKTQLKLNNCLLTVYRKLKNLAIYLSRKISFTCFRLNNKNLLTIRFDSVDHFYDSIHIFKRKITENFHFKLVFDAHPEKAFRKRKFLRISLPLVNGPSFVNFFLKFRFYSILFYSFNGEPKREAH